METYKYLKGLKWLLCEVWSIEECTVIAVYKCNFEGEKQSRINETLVN